MGKVVTRVVKESKKGPECEEEVKDKLWSEEIPIPEISCDLKD